MMSGRCKRFRGRRGPQDMVKKCTIVHAFSKATEFEKRLAGWGGVVLETGFEPANSYKNRS